jgi:hypothetical protein
MFVNISVIRNIFTIYLNNVRRTYWINKRPRTGHRARIEMALLHATQEKAGSVGASWPPRYDSHNSRVKGFCTRLIDSKKDAEGMFSVIGAAERTSPHATRTTVRAFVRSGLVEELRREGPYAIEAAFDASNAVPGHHLAYFGRNAPRRASPPEVVESERESVGQMRLLERTDFASAIRRVSSNGYSLSRLNGDGQQEVPRLLALYQEAYQEYTFQISPQTISDMLSNGNIVIVGRDGNSEVVSSLVAEHAMLMLDVGRSVHLFELSDYATFRAHRGMGLITLMQMEAINAIRREAYGERAIIYAEDRAAWMAVNRSSRRAGMHYCGTLPQHCVIVSDRDFGEEGRLENLNVWADLPGRARMGCV